MNLIILLDNIYRFSDQKLPNPVQISVFSNMCESENVTFLIPSPNMSIDSFVTVTGWRPTNCCMRLKITVVIDAEHAGVNSTFTFITFSNYYNYNSNYFVFTL